MDARIAEALAGTRLPLRGRPGGLILDSEPAAPPLNRERAVPDLRHLPFDNTYARLGPPFGERVEPTPLLAPHPVAWNPDAAALLGIDPGEAENPFWTEAFSGNAPLPGAEPTAMLYAGHQFGAWVPQLGDGRAILLGEVIGPDGRWDLHLKGAGITPYSRGFDGRAVLRSTIREYLCSEAMHGLGIPTTRALCIVGSDEPVRREKVETAATLVRLAPSHVRFGSFHVFAARGQHEQVRTLADYVINEHFPDLADEPAPDRYVRLLAEVVVRTARLVAQWQAVGWTHGVLNTDNMSILGLTIDYGPFGFMDDFEARFIPNHSDEGGRYAYNQQPRAGLWNLSRLGQALLSLMDADDAKAVLEGYEPIFLDEYSARLRAKLGLVEARDEDTELVDALFALLSANPVDFTRFWRLLGRFSEDDEGANVPLRDLFVDWAGWAAWAERYAARLEAEGSVAAERRARMDAVNPKYILRTYLAERAIRMAEDERDFSEIERLRVLLRDPFAEQPEMESYAEPPPEWGRKLVLSCSS
jgi:serine/tyrosine/threonine adenylyltransferase